MSRQKYEYTGLMNIPVKYDPKAKDVNAATNMKYMLARTRRMMRWDSLPETIPERDLELMLQTNGHVCIAKVDGDLYAFTGSFGGVPNAYYKPTQYIVANPYLKLSKSYTIGEDCVIIQNDSMYMGLLPMLSKYCSLIAESELTLDIVTIMARAALVMDSEDENERRSAEDFIEKLEKGNLGIIAREGLLEGVNVQPGSTQSASVITNLIECIQYLKASQFNELGLNANWNAKRETLTSSETLLNSDTLLPFCEDMLECRRDALDAIQEMFGETWSVDFDSAWENNMKELEMTEKQMELGLEVTEAQQEMTPTEDAGGGSDETEEKTD